jgi:hypothetical protein
VTELEEELLRLFRRGVDAPLPDPAFDTLARRVFAHQYELNAPYRAYCDARGAHPGGIEGWRDIPPLPTAAFKWADFTTVPADRVRVEYRTSGTTGGRERRGRHLLPDTRLYDASLEAAFRARVLPDVDRVRILVWGPSADTAPHSSLGHMLSFCLEHFGAPGSEVCWDPASPDFDRLDRALTHATRDGDRVCLLGTAFAFVHFLDWLADRGKAHRLPAGSRLMDTGGYKGRSREVSKADLYGLYGKLLGIPLERVINEYGMTELGSQAYDDVLAGGPGDPDERIKVTPPWLRIEVVDAETLTPVPVGGTGLVRCFDLANLHTVSAILVDDLAVRRPRGFEVLGRARGAELRGCSLMAEDLPGAPA